MHIFIKNSILRISTKNNTFAAIGKRKGKNLMRHSHNFFLPYITVEEYFINSITFIFNLYFICFVIDELPAFIIIVYNF